MVFPSEGEAKRFLIEKIAARALAEGHPLSEEERSTLASSAEPSVPTLACDAHAERQAEPDYIDEQFEKRMADLLRRSYDLDGAAARGEQRLYREALVLLAGGEHYLSWVARVAGLGPPMPEWLTPVRQVGLVVLLVVPALVAFLVAAAGAVWAVIGPASRSRREIVGMSVVALVFAGFGSYLLVLWSRERRSTGG
jgi:hypothetical protein